jgi:hypothetical protein
MPKEKRNNLAIYTLAGSILISSVLVSMNQAQGSYETYELERKIDKLEDKLEAFTYCVNSNFSSVRLKKPTRVNTGC